MLGTSSVLSNSSASPWDSPGKNTGVGCHALLQGDLSDPGIKPTSPALAGKFFTTEPIWEAKPAILKYK